MPTQKQSSLPYVFGGIILVFILLRTGLYGVESIRTRDLTLQAISVGISDQLSRLDQGPLPPNSLNRAAVYDQVLDQMWKHPKTSLVVLNVTSIIGNSYQAKYRNLLDPYLNQIVKGTFLAQCNFHPSSQKELILHKIPTTVEIGFSNLEMLYRFGRILCDRTEFELFNHQDVQALADSKAVSVLANDISSYPWSFARFWGEGLQKRLIIMSGLRSLDDPKVKNNMAVAEAISATCKPAPPLLYTLSGDFTYLKQGWVQPDLGLDPNPPSLGGALLGTPSDLEHASMRAIMALQTTVNGKPCMGPCVDRAQKAINGSQALGNGIVSTGDFQPFCSMDVPSDNLTSASRRMLRQAIALIKQYQSTGKISGSLPLSGNDKVDPVSGYQIGFEPHKLGFRMWSFRIAYPGIQDQSAPNQKLNMMYTWQANDIPSK